MAPYLTFLCLAFVILCGSLDSRQHNRHNRRNLYQYEKRALEQLLFKLREYDDFQEVQERDGDDHNGQGTFYSPGLGACGGTNSDSDLVCALSLPDYGGNNDNCGKQLSVTGPKGTVVVTVVDKCIVCQSGSLDLSPAAFNQIGDPNAGIIPISWHFV